MRWFVLWLLLGSASIVGATVNTYQEGATGCGNTNCGAATPDIYVYSLGPTTNYDGNQVYGVGLYADGAERALFQFDLGDITAGATITACVLRLQVTAPLGTPTAGKIARFIRTDWVENQVTWNDYKTGTPWTTAGIAGDGTDYTSTNQVSYTAPTGAGAFDFADIATLCQTGFDADGKVRLRLKQDTDTGTGTNMFYGDSAESVTAGQRPKLTVTFTAGGLGARMRKLLGVGRRGPYWPEDYEPPYPLGIFLP